MSVAYDNSVASQGSAGAGSWSVPFTAAAGADVFFAIAASNTTAPTLSAVQYGGVAMTLVYDSNPTATGRVSLYRLAGGGTGSSANFTGTCSLSGSWLSIEGASYTGVSSVGAPVHATAATTSVSTGSVSCTTGQMILAVCGGASTIQATISAPTGGTNRQIGNTTGSTFSSLALSDSTSTATFGVSFSTSQFGSAIAVVMTPAAGTTISPASATVAITGSTPVINPTGSLTVSPPAATVTITGSTPTLLFPNVTVSPATATVAISGGKPWVIQKPFDIVTSKLAAGQSPTILVIGDSTAYGYNDTYQTTLFGWVGRLAATLGAHYNVNAQVCSPSGLSYTSGVSVYTSSLGGSAPTISMMLDAVVGATLANYYTYDSYFIAPVAADLVIIQDGFNENTGTFGSNYLGFVNYVRSVQPGVPILLTTENNTGVTGEGGHPTFATLFASMISTFLPGESLPLSPTVQASSAAALTWVIDSQQAGLIPSVDINASDGIHPTSSGYAKYANYLLSQLLPQTVGTISPASATVAITGSVPSLAVSGNTTVTPASATVSVTGSVPPLNVSGLTVSPASATISIIGATPTVAVGNFVNPSGATVSLTGSVPQIGLALSPAAATVHVTTSTALVAVVPQGGVTVPPERTAFVALESRSTLV